MTAEVKAGPLMSFALALREPGDVAKVASELHSLLGHRADSIRISVRGSASALVSVLQGLKGRAVGVSASLSIKGDTPAKR